MVDVPESEHIIHTMKCLLQQNLLLLYDQSIFFVCLCSFHARAPCLILFVVYF